MLLHSLLNRTTDQMPDNLALITMEGSQLTYTEFSGLVAQCAATLRRANLEDSSRIGIYLPKHLLSAVAPFAISSVGCVFVPINPLLTEDQIEHIVQDCDLQVLITSPDRALRLDALIKRFGLTVVLTERDGYVSGKDENVLAWGETAGATERLTTTGENSTAAKTLAALLYTSGSTGKPKGVMVSHENLVLGAQSVNQYLSIMPRDRLLAVLPFSFDYGLNQLVSAVAAGACCVLFEYLFPQDVVKAIAEHQITGLAGVPTLWVQLTGTTWPDGVADSVRYITNSGGHLPRPVLGKLQNVFMHASPVLMYGLTEAFRSTYLPPEQIDARPDSIGVAIPNSKILVVNDQSEIAAPDEEGELVHCGPLVAMGYWRRPDETAAVFRPLPAKLAHELELPVAEPVVWSGDRVRRDADGYLYFLGRRDAMIKTSGYRVSSEEIEEALFAHEYVDAVAAVGLPDEKLGQAIVICVTLSDLGSNLSPQTLRKALLLHCRHHLPSYLIPKAIYFHEQLPHNPNGKIDRKQLASMLVDEQQNQSKEVG